MNDELASPRRRPYIVPLQVMVPVTLITIYLAVAQFRYASGYATPTGRLRLYFFVFFWPALMLAETAVYWLLRYRLKASINITMHLATTFMAFVLVNIIFILANYAISYRSYDRETILRLTQIRVVLFWLLVITGHAFFTTALVKVFRRKDENTDEDQPKGLLDDLLDEE